MLNRSQIGVFFFPIEAPPGYNRSFPKYRPIKFVRCPYIRPVRISIMLWYVFATITDPKLQYVQQLYFYNGQGLGRRISIPRVLGLKPFGDSKTVFHLFEVDQMSTRISCGLNGKKQTLSMQWLLILETVEPHP